MRRIPSNRTKNQIPSMHLRAKAVNRDKTGTEANPEAGGSVTYPYKKSWAAFPQSGTARWIDNPTEYHFMPGSTHCLPDLPSLTWNSPGFAKTMLPHVFRHSWLDPKITVLGKEWGEIIHSFLHGHKYLSHKLKSIGSLFYNVVCCPTQTMGSACLFPFSFYFSF